MIYRAASKGIKVGDALVAVDMKACQVWFVCVCVCVCVCTKTEPLAHFAVSINAYVSGPKRLCDMRVCKYTPPHMRSRHVLVNVSGPKDLKSHGTSVS